MHPEPSRESSYRIAIEAAGTRVRLRIDGEVVADSTDVQVMHETYLPSQIYFPKTDLIADLLAPSALRTFCPFKGTAHHWHLRIEGRTIENGA